MLDETSREIAMDDESLPLHFYNIENGSTLTDINPSTPLNIVNVLYETYYNQFPREFTLSEVKKTMASAKRFYGYFDFYDIIMFTKAADNVYKKLDLNLPLPIGDIFSDGDTIYLTMDNFYERSCPLYFSRKQNRESWSWLHRTCTKYKAKNTRTDRDSHSEHQKFTSVGMRTADTIKPSRLLIW